jgi:hypothetical protein
MWSGRALLYRMQIANPPHYVMLALGGDVAATITRFIALEVRAIDPFCRFGFLATLRHWSFIAVIRM